jgi:hypothetical protein
LPTHLNQPGRACSTVYPVTDALLNCAGIARKLSVASSPDGGTPWSLAQSYCSGALGSKTVSSRLSRWVPVVDDARLDATRSNMLQGKESP